MGVLIYVATSIPSFYHETRLEVEHQARRQWRRAWWNLATGRDTLAASVVVITELERALESKRLTRILLLDPLPLLESSVEVDDLVAAYLIHKVMPQGGAGDVRHLALATFHGCDILVTWNCRHIANADKQAHIRRVNGSLGYATPLELLETDL